VKGGLRSSAAVAAALLAWPVAATAGNLLARALLAGYREAEPTMNFSGPMLAGRLAVGVLASIACGMTARFVAGRPGPAPWVAGLAMLVVFVPTHITLWPRFPVAYHLFFLSSLVVVPPLAARGIGRHQP
jgi:hypothetical protein